MGAQQRSNLVEASGHRVHDGFNARKLAIGMLIDRGRRMRALAQGIARIDDCVAKLVRIDDASEVHVIRLPSAVASGFELQRGQVKLFK